MEVTARGRIKETWDDLIPDYPVNIESVNERFEWYHRENANYAKFIGSCCLISLFLSMIGLFAISINTSRNKDFLKWTVIAFIIAVPVSWFIMNKWLENFAYKTVVSWWIFALAGGITLIIALLTISWQSMSAATQNPVDTLRYE